MHLARRPEEVEDLHVHLSVKETTCGGREHARRPLSGPPRAVEGRRAGSLMEALLARGICAAVAGWRQRECGRSPGWLGTALLRAIDRGSAHRLPAAQKCRNRGALRGRGSAAERAAREMYEDPRGGAHLVKAREPLLDKRNAELRGHRHAESRQPPDPAARLDRESTWEISKLEKRGRCATVPFTKAPGMSQLDR